MLDENNLDVGLISQAIVYATNGTAEFNLSEKYSDLEWLNCETHSEKPTLELLEVWIEEYQNHLNSVSYKKDRQKTIANGGYGTWQEQFELMQEQGFDAWVSHCQTVKNNIPKP